MTNGYNSQDDEKVTAILNWLGGGGLKFMQTLNDKEQGKSQTSIRLFEMHGEKFEPQHNVTIHPCNIAN